MRSSKETEATTHLGHGEDCLLCYDAEGQVDGKTDTAAHCALIHTYVRASSI